MSVLARFRGYGILAAAAIVFSVSVFFSVDKMLKEQAAINSSDDQNIIWATARTEIELYQFADALSRFSREDSDVELQEVSQRFEILIAQVDVLRRGALAQSVRSIEGFGKTEDALATTLAEVEPELAFLRRGDRVQVEKIRARVLSHLPAVRELSVKALHLDNAANSSRRDRVKNVYVELVGYFIGILVSGSILVVLLFRGIRRAQNLLEERERTEERLRESEQRFRDFASSASDWLWDTDDRLRFTYFSKGYLERVGVNAVSILGKTFEEIAVIAGDEDRWTEFRDLLARRQPFREFRFQLKTDGTTVRHIMVSGVPVFDPEGNLLGYRGTGTDISEQVEAEREANRVRTLLQDAVEALAEGFIILDPQDRLVLCNSRYRSLYRELEDLLKPGVSFEELVRAAIQRRAVVVPPGQEENWIQTRMAEHRNPRASTEQQLAGGRWVQVNEQALANGWLIGTRVDITQLKQREEALRREALIWEQMYDGVIITNLSGTVTNWNPAAEAVFGYAAQEMIGLTPDRLYRPEDTTGQTTRILDAVRRDGRWSGEIDFIRKDGSEGICQTVVAPLRTAEGGLVAAIWVNQDITEQKLSEVALRGAKEQAESANIAKSRFLATMSHEIRTPMNGVLGMLDLVLDTNLSPEQHGYVETARKSGEALLVIIDDVLDFSKMEAGKFTLDTSDFELRDVIEGVLGLLSVQAQAKGIEVSAVIEPDVPTRLRGDPGRLRQILLNLTGNAVKFTERGGVGITVSKESGHGGPVRLKVEIADTGVGIPEDRQRDLFGEFTQVDPSTTRRYGGTGLGLAISKKLTELMGGQIGFSSTVGKGSTFWFTAEHALQPGPQPFDEAWDGRIGHRRVLVLDDNPMSGRILGRRLALRGLDVVAVERGEAALAALLEGAKQGKPFDLVITDSTVSDLSATALLTKIRGDSRCGKPHVVLLTSVSERETSEKAKAAGFSGHLSKPIRQQTLVDLFLSLFVAGAARAARPVESEARPQAATPSVSPATRFKARVLMAEDSKINQVVAIAMLSKSGFQIDAVENGREALEAVQARPYDLVLMDVSMPLMDGLDASRAIRALPGDVSRIPIIAMTAHAMESDREKCLAAGMNDYVSKPVNRQKLLDTVARWLGTEATRTPATTKIKVTVNPAQRSAETPQTKGAPQARSAPQPNGPAAAKAPAKPAAPAAKPAANGNPNGNDHVADAMARVLDLEVLAQLERDTNSEILKDLVRTFVNETAERLRRMVAAVEATDVPMLGREAHALKSSSGTFGAIQLQAQAKAIEAAAREGKTAETLNLMKPIHAMALEASRALARHLAQPPAPKAESGGAARR